MEIEEIKKFFKSTWKTISLGLLIALVFLILLTAMSAPDFPIIAAMKHGDYRWIIIFLIYCFTVGILLSIFMPVFRKNKVVFVFIFLISGGIAGLVGWFIPPRPFESLFFYIAVGSIVGAIPLADFSWLSIKDSDIPKDKE